MDGHAPSYSFKIYFVVSQSYFKFSFAMPNIFKISLRHYNWPIRCLFKNSCVAKMRFKKLSLEEIHIWRIRSITSSSLDQSKSLNAYSIASDEGTKILLNLYS